MSREKNPKYESMSLEELKANIPEKSRWTEGGTDQWIYKKIAEDTKGRKRTGKEV